MRKQSISIALVIIATIAALSCTQNKVSAVLDDIETYIEARPDSALAVLETLDAKNLNTKSQRAHYALLYSIALDKNYIDVAEDSLITIAVKYYDKKKKSQHRARAYYYLGRVYQNADNQQYALLAFRNSTSFSDSTDYHLLGLAYRGLMDVCTHMYRNQEALAYAEKAYNYFAKGDKKKFTHYALLNLAMTCHNNDLDEKACSLYSMTMDSAKYYQETQLYALAARDYAYHLRAFSNTDSTLKSQKLFQESISIAPNSFTLKDYCNYADLEFEVGDIEYAETLLTYAKRKAKTLVDSLNICYSEGKKLYEQGKYKEGYDCLYSSIDGQNKVFQKIFNSSAFQAEKDMFKEKAALADYRLQVNRGISKSVIIIAILLIIFIIKTTIQKLSQKEREIEQIRENVKTLESRLLLQQRNNEKFYEQMKAICGFELSYFDKILVDYDTYSRSENKKDEILAALDDLIASIRSQQKYESLEALVNVHQNGLMKELREKVNVPDEMYYKIACYYCCGFTTSFISLLTGLSQSNLYNRKKRLKDRIRASESMRKDEIIEIIG